MLQIAEIPAVQIMLPPETVRRGDESYRFFRKAVAQDFQRHRDIGYYASMLHVSPTYLSGGAQSIRQPGERACRAASECRGGANACAYVLHHIPLKRGMCHSCKNLNSEAVMQVDTSSVNSRPLQHVFG